ncbi:MULTISPECIES: curlin [Aliiglaciecola]|uniref:curlin n=1 Tax=Aliiglaciecola TaxID=1406885 RepID=UPI001C089534|nr:MULTISPECIES: curlin [Aliiglaciecola]MBU2877109.1 curlin [Aliiglaciecola lipolytica]MDO6710172.1 curlin [Aliiglaciecola sp. 2_MG-2023]MDO6751320.1 curlin [Aliiglaciecola sp. 1_MG-2023]
MKFRKTTVASSIILAVLAGQVSIANAQTAIKDDNPSVQSDFMIAAVGNVINLTQSAPVGNAVGNEALLMQEGDFNGLDVTIVGDANMVDAEQFGDGNIIYGVITGDENAVELYQNGIENDAEIVIEGSFNEVEISQMGDGGPFGFIFNRSINDITGDGNLLVVDQGDGGNWANNSITGFDNEVEITQTEDWQESYIRTLVGDGNEVEVYQGGYYNVADIAEITGNDNDVRLESDGDYNRIYGYVYGDDNTIDFEQSGDDNYAELGIFEGDGSSAEITQMGTLNEANIDNLGDSSDYEITQIGYGNIGYTGSIGGSNDFSVFQNGDLNLASTVNFDGFDNEVSISQQGDENTLLAEAGVGEDGVSGYYADANTINAEQMGNQNDAVIRLGGSNDSHLNTLDVAQSGDLNVLDLLIDGSDNSIDILQEGNDNWIVGEEALAMTITGDGMSLSISQVGNDNLVTGSMSGTGGSISVSQVGDYNVASITQL